MLAVLAGELTNSATYFSTFGNVSYGNIKNSSGSFSYTSSSSTWRPWSYEHRLKVAKGVVELKKIMKKTLAASTVRTKVTTFIASKNSRQEFPPPIGKLIDGANI